MLISNKDLKHKNFAFLPSLDKPKKNYAVFSITRRSQRFTSNFFQSCISVIDRSAKPQNIKDVYKNLMKKDFIFEFQPLNPTKPRSANPRILCASFKLSLRSQICKQMCNPFSGNAFTSLQSAPRSS